MSHLMITTGSRITRNGRADSALTCSAPVGPDFGTNGEQTATNPFAVYGERAQLSWWLLRGGSRIFILRGAQKIITSAKKSLSAGVQHSDTKWD